MGTTVELDSYLVQHNLPGTVAPEQVDNVSQKNSNLMDTMTQLLTQVEQLEMRKQLEGNSAQRQAETFQSGTVLCNWGSCCVLPVWTSRAFC